MNPNTLLALIARPSLHEYAVAQVRNYRDLIGRDEAKSAADEGLVEACERYEPSRGPFLPFARLWVLRQLYKAIRREIVWRRRMVTGGEDHLEVLDEHSDCEVSTVRKQVERALGEEGFRMWARHAEEGDTLREIARGYGLSLRQVRRRVGESQTRIWTLLGETRKQEGVRITHKRSRRRSGRW